MYNHKNYCELGFGHYAQSTCQEVRRSRLSEFEHLTRFGMVKFSSHVLCPLGDLLAEGVESWKTKMKKNVLVHNTFHLQFCTSKFVWLFKYLQNYDCFHAQRLLRIQ